MLSTLPCEDGRFNIPHRRNKPAYRHFRLRLMSCRRCLGMYISSTTFECRTHSRVPFSEDESAEQIVSRHIGLLHRYNEAKDAAQVRNLASSGPPVILTVDGADPHREGESSSFCSSQ